MARKLKKAKTLNISRSPRHRRDAGIAAVPTFRADPEAAAMPPSSTNAGQAPLSSAEDDKANDAVRRIVEAAYT